MKKTTRRFTILDMMLLIAGAAVGLWLVIVEGKDANGDEGAWLFYLVFLLGGLSTIGPPLLLWERYRRPGSGPRPRFRAGEFLWFCQGTATWLLWPPVIFHRVQARGGPEPRVLSSVCFFYGTPLMAIYVTIALIAGGWLRRPRRGARARRSWTETFGLILGLIWACTGLYMLAQVYRSDLFK